MLAGQYTQKCRVGTPTASFITLELLRIQYLKTDTLFSMGYFLPKWMDAGQSLWDGWC